MGESVIGFERIDHLILIAAECVTDDLYINSSDILVVNYSDYVKSQLHLNITNGFFDKRSPLQYKAAYDYIKGVFGLETDALNVLNYFYEDMINFLKNNKFNIKLRCYADVTFPNKSVCRYNYSKQRAQLQDAMSRDFVDFDSALSYVSDNKAISGALDTMKTKQDVLERLDSYCAINIMKNYKSGVIPQWEVRDEV